MISKISTIRATFNILSRPERIGLVGAGLILFTSLLFWVGLVLDQKTTKIPVAGGEYHEGLTGQPVYINPVIADNDADRDIAALIYAPLTDLVKDYSLGDEGKVYIVNLKENLLWSDDERITSDDVIFTVKTIQDANARSPLFQTWQGVIAERESEIQLRFVLRSPYVFFGKNLERLPVIPKHIFDNVPPANLRLSNYNLEPVGNGPYKFSGYEKRKDGFIGEYRLAANENYPGKKPFIEKFVFKFYETEDALVSAFNARAIDGFGGINPKNVEYLSPNRKISQLILPRHYAIFFNPSINAALKDKNLRLALIQSVNKKRIIEEVFGGQALEVDGPLLVGLEGYNAEAYAKIEYAPELAKETITALKEKNKNLGLEFNIVVPQVEFLVKTAEMVKEDWEAAGVKINLVVLNPSDIAGEVIRTRNYEMLLFGSIIANSPDLFSFWHSSERFFPGLNLSIFNSGEVDELLEKVRQTSAPEERS